MPLGEEVGDAYIEVHADTSTFRRELQREAKAAGQAAGRDFGKGMDSELDSEMSLLGRRLRKSLTEAGVKSGIGFSEGLEDAVVSRMRRFTGNLQESMVSGDWTRVLADFDSLGKGIDAVNLRLASLRDQGALTDEQFRDATKSLEKWQAAIGNSEAEDAFKRMTDDLSTVGEEFQRQTEDANRQLEKLGKNRAARRLKRDLDLSDFEDQMNRINEKAFTELSDGLEGVGDGLKKITRDGERLGITLENNLAKKRFRLNLDLDDWEKQWDRAIDSGNRAQAQLALDAEEANQRIIDSLQREYRQRQELNEDMINDRRDFWDAEIAGSVRSEKAIRRWAKNSSKEIERMRKRLSTGDMDWLDTEALDRALNRFADNSERSFKRVGRSIDTGFIGRMKGARNDFVNLVGVVGGGIERVFIKGFDKAFTAIGGGIEKIGGALSGLGPAGGVFDRMGQQVQTFGSIVGTVTGGPIGQFLVTAVALVGALGAMVPILGTIVAGVYGLSGAFTALLVSVGGAALGALLSLGPMLLAVGAGAGAAVIGILGMTDAMKDALRPLEEWYDAIKDVVAERLFANIENQVDGLVTMLNTGLNPILEKSADRLREFIDEMIEGFSSDRMQDVLAPLTVLIPQILGNILDIVKEVSFGLSGLFAAISPIVADVTDDIAAAAKEWSDWVNSAKGQVAIKDFFNDAKNAAEELWKIASAVWDVIKVLFEEGNETGQQFLETISDLVTDFAEWLGSDEGRAELAEWFEYAKEVASQLADVIESLMGLWDELNTPYNRFLFLYLLETVEGLIDGLAGFAGWIDEIVNRFLIWYQNVQTLSAAFGDLWYQFTTAPLVAWAAVSEWWNGTVLPWFQSIPEAGRAGFEALWNNLTIPIAQKWAEVVNWWNTVAVPFINSWPAMVAAPFVRLWNEFTLPLKATWNKVKAWWDGTVMPFFDSLPAKAAAPFLRMWNGFWAPLNAAWARVTGWWNGTVMPWFNGLAARVAGAFIRLWNGLPAGIGAAWGRVTGWWSGTAMPFFRSLPERLVGVGREMIYSLLAGIKSVWYQVESWLRGAVRGLTLTLPTPRIPTPRLPFTARGGVFAGAQTRIIGEAGPEAVVPLDRPLWAVDPAVRALSAVAQGKTPAMAAGGVGGGGVSIAEGAISVYSSFANPRLVAEDVLSGLVTKFK